MGRAARGPTPNAANDVGGAGECDGDEGADTAETKGLALFRGSVVMDARGAKSSSKVSSISSGLRCIVDVPALLALKCLTFAA